MFRRTRFQHAHHFPVVALWLVFFLNGAVLSSWAPRIPEVAAELRLSDTDLGAALFGIAAGSVPALLLTGRLLRRISSRTLCLAAAAGFVTALPLISVASNALMLGPILALLGASSGVLDIAMNTAGIDYQQRRGSAPIISRLHGGYSLGVLSGAAGGAVATAAGQPVSTHFVVTSAVLLVLLIGAGPHLPGSRTPSSEASGGADAARVPFRRVITPAIAVAAIAGLLLEGVVTDWSALLISRDFGAGLSAGSTAVVAFSLAMFFSRSIGDWTVTRLGRARYLIITAAVAIAGTSIGLVVPTWIAAYAGVVVVGLALGPVFPLAIDAATERAPTAVASAAAAVSAVGYLAYLGGPPVIGLVAHWIGLPPTNALFGAICAAALAIAATRIAAGIRSRTEADRSTFQ